MKTKILATLAVLSLLGIAILGLRHIKNLDNQIQLKQIQLKDNSARLKLLDSKYIELNKELEAKDVDKAKVEQQLKDLQIERDKLQADLQAKKEQKAKDLAVKAEQALQATVSSQKAYATTGCTDAKSCIYFKESGNRTNAINTSSGACGIGQAWPCSKMPCTLQDYACQDAFFTNYAQTRYNGWENAWAFWQANHYW